MNIPPKVTVEVNPASVEHAVLQKVKRYWDEKRGLRRMPSRRDIRPAEIKECLPQVLLVDVLPDASDFRYRLVGSKLRPYFPNEVTGQLFSRALAPFGESTVAATLSIYRGIVHERTPALIKGPGIYYAQESNFFEAILMPLGEDDAHPTMIFGAFEFDWKYKSEGR